MNECPICGKVCDTMHRLGDHIIRAHHSLMMGDPPRRMVSASAKRDGFAGFFCWCGEPVYMMPYSDSSDGFLQHCADRGGVTTHLLSLLLGINGEPPCPT